MSDFLVIKFGGSSVKDASAMLQCLDVIRKHPDKKLLVILSATWQTTNQLEQIAEMATRAPEAAIRLFDENRKRHHDLGLELSLEEEYLKKIHDVYQTYGSGLKHFSDQTRSFPPMMDELYSLGEIVSSILFKGLLDREMNEIVSWVDAREFIETDSLFNMANPDPRKIKKNVAEKLLPLFIEGRIVVSQGFIGRDEGGATTTLGREGSDYSAALFAEALAADEIHIMTDVPGIAFCDPRYLADATIFSEMDYDHAATMTDLGAKVLFPKTMSPAKRAGIPIRVAQTSNPEFKGTKIFSGACNPQLSLSLERVNEDFFRVYAQGECLPGIEGCEGVVRTGKKQGAVVFEVFPDNLVEFLQTLHAHYRSISK